MDRVKWLAGLLAIAFLMGACATIDESKATFKKTFPGRDEGKPAAADNTRK